MTTRTWTVQILLGEDEDTTTADAVLETQGKNEIRGHGTSRRNPDDPSVPMIGEELATARALSDLAHQLLTTAARDIESSTRSPASLHL
ncbi:MAG TPA: DUF1876 domain-containing protein [Nocardioidaceae bacterium]|jgi:hypothetical protein|nr:DUF1876 domain-containing protein [Nocardioidaceae bacterium]